MYRSLVSAWREPEAVATAGREGTNRGFAVLDSLNPPRLVDRMILADQMTYLVDDQLAKVDRASMAVSLEIRVPLLDHRIVAFAWQLPLSMKMRNGQGKWLLRQLLFRRVPSTLVQRPKMGWSLPLAQWLSGPLRPWAEELLKAERLDAEGLLRSEPVRVAWKRLLGGEGDVAPGIWAVLMFQAWRERWLST
jgi:asparagine synthase (glutamine-hydrolysing)